MLESEIDMKSELVSIIVPIYNVEPYLDECIVSLVSQTYTNLEILLINDGSTDDSLKKCEEWKEKDRRIRVFSKENEGLGPTRNLGVKKATGEWIAFVDADDWVELTYIEKLHTAVVEENADMARCLYRQIEASGGNGRNANHFQALGIRRTQEKILIEDAPHIWTILVRKNLFQRFYLEQPNCKGQDFAVGLAVCIASKKIAYVDGILYNYRKNRPGALTTGGVSKRSDTARVALPWLVNILKKNGLYEEHVELLERHVSDVLSHQLFGGWMNLNSEKYIEIKKTYDLSMSEELGYVHKEISVLGSWNLTEATRKLYYLQDMDYAFHFSSLISVMSSCDSDIEISHKSAYREKMIQRDIKSVIWDVYDRKQPDYFVFDLLEERHHIIKSNDCYITESNAFTECGMHIDNVQIIRSGSDEWYKLWKQSCDAFMTKMQDYLVLDKVIMIRNYLTEAYGTAYEQTVYEDIQTIKSENEVISHCYDYIKENYPEIKVVDVSDDEHYITDINYEYGVYPWYLNTLINEKIADCVRQIIDKK